MSQVSQNKNSSTQDGIDLIKKTLDPLEWGEAHIRVVKYQGKIGKIEVPIEDNIRPKNNVEGLATVYQIIKNSLDNGGDERKTFTLDVKGGKIKEITIHTIERHIYA